MRSEAASTAFPPSGRTRSAGPSAPPGTLALALSRSSAGLGTGIAILTIFAAALAFGATSMPTMVLVIAGFCLALVVGVLSAPSGLAFAVAAPLAGVAALAGIAVLQEASPPMVLEPAGIWADLAASGRIAGRPQLAFSDGRAVPALAGPLLAALAMSCGILAGRSRRHASATFLVLSVLGTGYCAAAILWQLYAPGFVLWQQKTAHVEDLTATFTNRNTAAIFIGAILVILGTQLAASIARISMADDLASGRMRARLKRLAVFNALGATLCFLALVQTNSRAGTVLSCMAFVFAVFLRLRAESRRLNRFGVATILGVFAVPVLLLIVLETRLSDPLTDGGRFAAYRATLAMIADHPWLGVGLGSFAAAFPLWRLPDAPMWGVWEKAHNTLLEIAAEAGVPFALSVLLAWCVVVGLLGRSALRRPDTTTAAALGITALGLSHSLIDFSIQIPGCGALFYFAVGIGIGRAVDRMLRPTGRGARG